jgi:hypothetical protein
MHESRSVVDVLRSMDDSLTTGDYTLAYYQNVFADADFSKQAREFVRSDTNLIALRLEDGNILNLTYRRLAPEIGARSFDMPILEKGICFGAGNSASWFIQPDSESPVSEKDLASFINKLDAAGYQLSDPDFSRLGYHGGEVRLVDPFAVTKKIKFVPDILWSIDPEQAERHNLELYAGLFADFPMQVREFIGAGSDSIAMRLEDGNILKITLQHNLPPPRAWDMPILESGTVNCDRYSLLWFVQPGGKTPIADKDFMPFVRKLIADGYQFTDPSLHNLAYYKGEVRLLDPFAVVKLSQETDSIT